MIQITTRRAGLIVIAANVNDLGTITTTIGLTTESATRRLIRRLTR